MDRVAPNPGGDRPADAPKAASATGDARPTIPNGRKKSVMFSFAKRKSTTKSPSDRKVSSRGSGIAAGVVTAVRQASTCRFSRPSTGTVLTPKVQTMGYGTIGRGVRKTIHQSELKMTQGGMNTTNRRLKEEDYLTEMLKPEETEWLLLPFGRVRVSWDLLMFILVGYTAIVLPIQLGFDTEDHFPHGLTLFEYTMDFIFMFDIFLNFRTAYVENANLIVDRKMIRQRYLRRWFAIDLAGSFPLDLVIKIFDNKGNSNTGFVTLIKVLKIPKMLRIGRFLKKLEKVEGAANVGGIFVLCLIMVVIVHWLACTWFLITDSSDGSGWLAANGLDGKVWTEQYAPIFYSTLMMVMGDSIDLQKDGELVFASTVVIIGACINATIFASVAAYVTQLNAVSAEHKKRMNWINHTLSTLHLSKSGLDTRISQYYEYCWVRHRDFASHQLMGSLPAVFSKRVALQAHAEMLRQFPPFLEAEERFLAELATKLHPEVYLPEAFILAAGQVWHSIYFIKRGKVEVTWPSETPNFVNVIEHDNYFGELGLFLNSKLNYTVRAMSHLDCFRLDRTDFEAVMRANPAAAIHVADMLNFVLPPKVARKVVEEVYEHSGIREVLSIFQNRRWRPPKGFAERVLKFATEDGGSLAKFRSRSSTRRRSHAPNPLSDRAKTPERSSDASAEPKRRSSASPPPAGRGSSPTPLGSMMSDKRLDAFTNKLGSVASAQSSLEAKVDGIQGQIERLHQLIEGKLSPASQ